MSDGTVRKNTRFVRRCPAYVRYFQQLGGMTKFLEDALIVNDGDSCPAAIEVHKGVKWRASNREQQQEKRYGR